MIKLSYITSPIKELVTRMKSEYVGCYKNSYEFEDNYFHFKVLDITDYEQNHYGYSATIVVEKSEDSSKLLEFEVFFDDRQNMFTVLKSNGNSQRRILLSSFLKKLTLRR